MADDRRYSRNVALFGQAGQTRIAASRVAIVGGGGIGSLVAQQLSHLGVGALSVVDPDVVTTSSLNRLVGATPQDAAAASYKAVVAQRMCAAILPEMRIRVVTAPLLDQGAQEAILACTSVMSCLDDDAARLDLIAICCRNGLPFFDLATDTGGSNGSTWYGGRVMFSGAGERCPLCMDLINQSALQRAAMSVEQLEVDATIYGVGRDDLNASGPSVVSLNGVVASLAVTEWMVWTTGLRSPNALVEYRGSVGASFISNDAPRPDCYYCRMWPTQRTATGF